MLQRLVTILAAFAALALVTAAPSRAQMVDSVVAVVNDDAITARELDGRLRMALISSGLPDSQESRQRVVGQLLRKIIDERLQLQEAQRLGIALSAAEVDAGIAMIEEQNRMPRGTLLANLARQGIDPAKVRDQIRADLTWMRLIGRVVNPQIRIGDEEVNDRLQSVLARQGQREIRVAEIFLPVEQPNQDEAARQLGEKLLDGLNKGTPFPALARQFSRSPTAASGGLLGWVTPGMVDDELAAILAPLTKGQTSGLSRTSSGYYIATVLDERISGQSIQVEDSVVTLARLLLPIPPGAPPKAQLMDRAAELTRPVKSCAMLEQLAAKAGATILPRLGPVKIGELPVELRQAVAALPANQAGPPLDVAEGIIVPVLCTREDALVATPPTAEQIRRQIEDERRDMLARRYLRDLRRSAFVDIRI